MMQSLVQVGGSAMLTLSGRGTHTLDTHTAKEADVFFSSDGCGRDATEGKRGQGVGCEGVRSLRVGEI
jgi:hypothetical protein